MAKVLKLTKWWEIEEIDADGNLGWQWCVKQIGCKYMEIVRPRYLPKGYVLVIDDEGRLKEDPVVNPIASFVYGVLEHNEAIIGDVLVMREECGPEGAELVGMNEEETEWMKGYLDNILENIMKQKNAG